MGPAPPPMPPEKTEGGLAGRRGFPTSGYNENEEHTSECVQGCLLSRYVGPPTFFTEVPRSLRCTDCRSTKQRSQTRSNFPSVGSNPNLMLIRSISCEEHAEHTTRPHSLQWC